MIWNDKKDSKESKDTWLEDLASNFELSWKKLFILLQTFSFYVCKMSNSNV